MRPYNHQANTIDEAVGIQFDEFNTLMSDIQNIVNSGHNNHEKRSEIIEKIEQELIKHEARLSATVIAFLIDMYDTAHVRAHNAEKFIDNLTGRTRSAKTGNEPND